MKIKLDEGARMPTRAHEWDAGLDLYAREKQVVPARGSRKFDTGVHVELPIGTAGFLKSKSGLNVNHGITSEGVIDAGDKISQLVILPICTPEPFLFEGDFEETERGDGGFGSTGR